MEHAKASFSARSCWCSASVTMAVPCWPLHAAWQPTNQWIRTSNFVKKAAASSWPSARKQQFPAALRTNFLLPCSSSCCHRTNLFSHVGICHGEPKRTGFPSAFSTPFSIEMNGCDFFSHPSDLQHKRESSAPYPTRMLLIHHGWHCSGGLRAWSHAYFSRCQLI